MAPRLQLQSFLEGLAESENVHFQPPNGLQLVYPCLVYERNYEQTSHADNKPYRSMKRYAVTAISRDPDDLLPDKLAACPLCIFDRAFKSDNLYHTIYNLFF